jgi:hypothetical protein
VSKNCAMGLIRAAIGNGTYYANPACDFSCPT